MLLAILRTASSIQVYLNALGLLLRVSVRGQMDCIVDRLTALVTALKDEVISLIQDNFWHLV